MSKPVDEHGGIKPSSFHMITKTDNRVFLFINTIEPRFNLDMFTNLLMNKVERIFITVHTISNGLPNIHPLITYISQDTDIETFLKTQILNEKTSHVFYTIIPNTTVVHPQFWELLEIASPGTNIQYMDENKNMYTLYSIESSGVAKNDMKWPIVAAYASWETDKERNNRAIQHAIIKKSGKQISQLIIESSNTFTPLCYLATKYMTDKSPYNIMTHRHPYTAVYDMFLRPLQRYNTLKLGEIGILNGASMRMWHEYFPTAELHGFDINESSLKSIEDIKTAKAHIVDSGNSVGLRNSLLNAVADGKKFDILIEDASHRLEHQLIFIRDAIDFLNPGGMLIVEDIFREIPLLRFQEAIDQISDKVQNAIMILPEHKYRFSPGWDNDRVLIIWRK